jgi:DNA-binding LacI/PurR family transcriptional regulator
VTTIDDVARDAGVSKSTVSNVFSKKRPISKEVSNRVLESARKLEYKPNYWARSLVSKETKIIGLSMQGENTKFGSFHLSLINGVHQTCYKTGYRLLINSVSNEYLNQVENQTSDPVDGEIILDPLVKDRRIEESVKKNRPVVVIGRPPKAYEARVSYVNNDNAGIARDVTRYLIGLGHRRILFLNATENSTVWEDRKLGYQAAHEEAGIPMDDKLVLANDRSSSALLYGLEQTARHLTQDSSITAVIADSDKTALGVYQAAGSRGCRIPEDLSVFAFSDDSSYSPEFQPPLSGVRMNSEALGEEAAKLLLEHCSGQSRSAKRVLIGAELVHRNSCGQASIR